MSKATLLKISVPITTTVRKHYTEHDRMVRYDKTRSEEEFISEKLTIRTVKRLSKIKLHKSEPIENVVVRMLDRCEKEMLKLKESVLSGK